MNKAESLLVLGKAASLRRISSKKLNSTVRNCQFRCIANSVDLQSLDFDKNINFDVQVSTRVDNPNLISPVLGESLLNQFGVRALCVNSRMDYAYGSSLRKFHKFYKDYNRQLLCMGKGFHPVSPDAKNYGGRGLTIVSSILQEAFCLKSLNSIYLMGIDFFGTMYTDSHREKTKEEQVTFYDYNACSDSPRLTHGLPLLRYINAVVNSNWCRPDFVVFLPREVSVHIPGEIKSSLLRSSHFAFF
tara:strand:+ start:3697 stop:4431 length:735 start_codon:yes stop_codon:yes gene_type:complete